MNLRNTKLHIISNRSELKGKASTGVSMHCHTENSMEMLDFVPHYAEKLPIIASFWRRERRNFNKRNGRYPDFSNAFWSPPLSPQDVFSIEKGQLESVGLNPIVSLTDHDSIASTLVVNETETNEVAPISMEWTVPFEYGFFHVGVHNLPKDRAAELTQTLLDFTFNKENHTFEKLTEMFALLHEVPQVLVILNHPLWDIEIVGKERHELLLKDFIRVHGRWIHAFEINGFRSWSENKSVIELAEAVGIPIVTGGDRHGCKPNTVINLSNADTFDGFADEIRNDKRSEVVLMPAYEQPLHSRQLESFSEILSHYPAYREGRRHWYERVHFDTGDGEGVRTLASHGWDNGGPIWLRVAVKTLAVLGSPTMRPLFRLARNKKDRVPKSVERADFHALDVDESLIALTSDPIG